MCEVTVLIAVLGMGAVTLLLKAVPLTLLGNRRLPHGVEALLRHLPIAVMSAMTVQIVAVKDGALRLSVDDATLWAVLPCVLTAIITRNLFATIAVGMGFVVVARLIGG